MSTEKEYDFLIYLEQAGQLINRGYPVHTTDQFKLAQDMMNRSMELDRLASGKLDDSGIQIESQ